MYNLTDFTLKELRMLSVAVSNEIKDKTDMIDVINLNLRHSESVKSDLIRNASHGLSELREMNVRILTSIDIVKNRESVQSN